MRASPSENSSSRRQCETPATRGFQPVLAQGIRRCLPVGRLQTLPEPLPRRRADLGGEVAIRLGVVGRQARGSSARLNIETSPASVTQARAGSFLRASPVSGFTWAKSAGPVGGLLHQDGVEDRGRAAARWEGAGHRHAVVGAEPACPLEFDRARRSPRAFRARDEVVEPAQGESGRGCPVSSRVSSNRLRSGPSGVSRSPSRTRFTPDRASRSARASAFAFSRKARGGAEAGRRRTGRVLRRRSSAGPSLPDTVTGPSCRPVLRAGTKNRAPNLGLDSAGRLDREPGVGFISDVVGHPRAPASAIGGGGDPRRRRAGSIRRRRLLRPGEPPAPRRWAPGRRLGPRASRTNRPS